MLIAIALIIALIILDQAVKYWAFVSLQAAGTIPIIQDIFHFTYVENRGAAFSLFANTNSRWIFVIFAIIISVAFLFALHKNMIQTTLGKLSLILIAGGALGNAIDRIIHGFVVDMFDFRVINFPIFNVADIFICVGGLLFVIYVMFQHKDVVSEKKNEPDSNNNTN